MPCPIDLYHGPASFLMSMPAAFQRLSSAIWVPERSPREMKGAPLALMLCSAKAAFLAPLMLAGSSFGPMMTKSLYITEWRFTPNPCAMNFSSASLACTKTTSASPRRAVSSALDDGRASGMVPFRIHARSVSHREQRLAPCVFHCVRRGLLHAVDDVLPHRDVIGLLGHLVALVVGPGEELERLGGGRRILRLLIEQDPSRRRHRPGLGTGLVGENDAVAGDGAPIGIGCSRLERR